MKKRGFTLAEMVITVGVIGFIAITVVGVLNNVLPNKEQVMLKKSYHLANRIINEMINNDVMYPAKKYGKDQYFANTEQTDEIVGHKYPADANKPEQKFCELFAKALNVVSKVECSSHTFKAGEAVTATLTTNDGVIWQLPITKFGGENPSENKFYDIIVDVNGLKGNNCFYGETVDGETCRTPDRFVMQINYKGKMNIPDSLAKYYIETDSAQNSYAKVAKKLSDDNNVVAYIPNSAITGNEDTIPTEITGDISEGNEIICIIPPPPPEYNTNIENIESTEIVVDQPIEVATCHGLGNLVDPNEESEVTNPESSSDNNNGNFWNNIINWFNGLFN